MKKTVLLSFLHSDTKGLRHINISHFTLPGELISQSLGEALNPPLGEMRHTGDREGSAAPNDKCRRAQTVEKA